MRYCLLLTLLFLSQRSNAQIKNPFAALRYDSVVMYDFIPAGEEGQIVFNGHLEGEIKKRVVLNDSTISALNRTLGIKGSYNLIIGSCFDPRLGFVYYKNGKIVGDISVCLACNQLYSKPAIKNRLPGLSTSMRHFFNQLLIKHNFSHSLTPEQEKKE